MSDYKKYEDDNDNLPWNNNAHNNPNNNGEEDDIVSEKSNKTG